MKYRHAAATHLLTVGEIADYLRVDRSTIYRLLKRKELPAFRSRLALYCGGNRPLACPTGS
jgi:excisionase family DNA binding protein